MYFFRETVCFLQNAVLALDSSTLDIDQVENLIKFCPTKEEMETLKVCSAFNYYYYSCNSFLLVSQAKFPYKDICVQLLGTCWLFHLTVGFSNMGFRIMLGTRKCLGSVNRSLMMLHIQNFFHNNFHFSHWFLKLIINVTVFHGAHEGSTGRIQIKGVCLQNYIFKSG